MRKLPFPLIFIAFLMLLVLVSGLNDQGNMHRFPDEHSEKHIFLLEPDSEMSDPPGGRSLVLYIEPGFSSASEKNLLEDNIEKSEKMTERFDEVISNLKEEGNEVRELEQMTANYGALVYQAREYLELAKNASSDSEEQSYLELSRESIIDANSNLKLIFDEIKKYVPGPASLRNETLVAEGSGFAILSGDLHMEITLSEGKFYVVDFAGDIAIDNEFNYEQESLGQMFPPRGRIAAQKTFSYVDVNGNVSLSGSSFSVVMMAERIGLVATGTGEAELVGNGTYYFDNGTSERKEKFWMRPLVEI